MRLKDLITEISAGEKRRQRAAQADAQRLAAQQQQQAQQAALAAKVQKRTQRKLDRFNQPIASTSQTTGSTTKPQSGSLADLMARSTSDADIEKYQVDPTVDTSFQGGKYLQFEKSGNNVIAYWSNDPGYTFDQVRSFGQFEDLGNVFDEGKFQALLNKLVNKFKYVHVLIKQKYVDDWALMNPKSFFRNLYYYLAKEYPRNQPTQSAYVNWEIYKDN